MRVFRSLLLTSTAAVTALLLATPAQAQDVSPRVNLKQLGVSFVPGTSPFLAKAPATPQSQHEGIGIGVLVGPLFDRFTSDTDLTDFKNRTGFQFSLFLGGNRPGRVGVATEISLLKRRAEIDGDLTSLTAIQVPVFVRVNVGSENLDRVSVYVKFGPAINVILKADSELFGDIKDDVEAFQVDVIGAVGVEITRFIIEGRYIQGIRAINKEFTDVEKIKTKSVAILFGVRFN